tara:strand:- start:559 stop:1278 length:720 start_codon:yes stop_codon:yes gene_type:complete
MSDVSDVTKVKHNAKFTRNITDEITWMLNKYRGEGIMRLLDPMGGVGGIFDTHSADGEWMIDMVEIEHEWAVAATTHPLADGQTDRVMEADFLTWLPDAYWLYDFVVTSPTYGNRMADHHEAKDGSKRNTYRHTLGRELTDGSSAGMQWSEEYRFFHEKAWLKVWDLLAPGGIFIVNVKDHIRKGVKQPVSAWHRLLLIAIGFELLESRDMPVRGNRQGRNGDVRVDHEQIYVFKKPVI